MQNFLSSFTVAVKIKQKISQIQIQFCDTQHSLYNKWLVINPDCLLSKAEVVTKLSAKLKLLSESDRVSRPLRQSLCLFVEKIGQESEQPSLQCQLSEIPAANSGVKSCFSAVELVHQRECKDSCTQTQSVRQQGKNVLQESFAVNVASNMRAQGKRNPTKQSKKIQKPAQGRRTTNQPKGAKNMQSTAKKRCNPDVLKACELILKKYPQNDIRNMARDFMKEKGYLPDEKTSAIKERRTVFITEQSEQKSRARHSQSLIEQRQTRLHRQSQGSLEVNKAPSQSRQIRRNRFNYLQSSIGKLSKEYEEREKTPQKTEVRSIKKYSYIDF